jgi:DNA-binding CsgD family transcriptional regulator
VLDPWLSRRPDLALGPRLESLSMTRREFDVVRLVATGMSNPEIAVDLGLTRNTVKTYLQTAMQKLGARNRVDAVAKAQAARLL